MLRVFLIVTLFVSNPIGAAELFGRIVSIHDGDTLTALIDKTPLKIRLLEIDAPELKQAFGQKSRQSLAELCYNKQAALITSGTDRYGRMLARVFCAGTDANEAQVHRGMAWVYDKYVTDHDLYRVQDEARSKRIGIWTEASPTAPWRWRHELRKQNSPQTRP